MALNKDWREFIELLNAESVDYLIVGAAAMGLHGISRLTGDIDFLIRPDRATAEKVVEVLRKFGFASLGAQPDDFLQPDSFVQLGYVPHRIDIMNMITGVSFEEAWANKVAVKMDDIPVFVLDRRSLIKNKRAVARPKDLLDVQILEEQ
jgi:hypothetical protein